MKRCCASNWSRSRKTAFDLDLVGFTDEEVEELLRDPEESNDGLTDDDAIPEEEEHAITVLGDVWVMGEHRLAVWRRHQMAAVQTVLAGGLADMVFTDPPYNVDYEGKTAKKLKIDNDTLGGKFYEFLRDACANMLAVTKGAIYICMSSSELHTLYQAFTDAGGHWSTFVIWAKHHFTLGRSDYQRQYEPILYGWREGHGALLVRRPEPGRRVVHQAAHGEPGTSDDEAGGTGRARDPQQQQDARHDPRSVRRVGDDDDRVREDRAAGARDRVGAEVLRRDCSSLAGVRRAGSG